MSEGKHGQVRETYLRYLLDNDGEQAYAFIRSLADDHVPLIDLYDDILQGVMVEIGEMWHRREITVDQEHYMTSFTQKVMSQFYAKIFSSDKTNCKALVCSVGSELHEMGARMISDLLEESGWDSSYLGAGVPKRALLQRVQKDAPDLMVLSVTMPQHLPECKEIVETVKKNHPDIMVAVGGRAFQVTNRLWEKWPADFYANKARGLLHWTNQKFGECYE